MNDFEIETEVVEQKGVEWLETAVDEISGDESKQDERVQRFREILDKMNQEFEKTRFSSGLNWIPAELPKSSSIHRVRSMIRPPDLNEIEYHNISGVCAPMRFVSTGVRVGDPE